ncbi:MerR family transcriptional regulator [Stygiobacter electus]|uniref:MerR family transcriptional regulator n=1 Tax=Stygiobacter electus TaxID=3032292 RepID=A0AAE3NWL9_9BACT|nr:MerR family transcriptional regulator [Stygiobacter electus]MDF1611421.1 MerR family transcriptional regulator [Stygiobacter electus]
MIKGQNMKDFELKKLYYSISEVSKLTGLEQYILRYWETEFEQLKPAKNNAGNRIYTNKDIKLILQIKQLLREEKYTIEGAKKILEESNTESVIQNKEIKSEQITERKINTASSIKNDLEEIKNFLIYIYNLIGT